MSGREQETCMTAQPLRKSQERTVQSRHHPSIQTAQRDSFQQRECSHLGSTVSEAEREFDFKTRTQAEAMAASEGEGRRRSSRAQQELLMFDRLWNICEPVC